MSSRRRAVRALLVLSALVPALAGCSGGGGGQGGDDDVGGVDPPGVAMILPGPISDGDANAVAYEALQSAGERLGLETAYTESVAVAQAEQVARGYIDGGFEIIILHGTQFTTVATTLALEFPDTRFVIQSPGPRDGLPDNVYNLARTYVPGFYLLGRLAARASASGAIGVLAGVDGPEPRAGADAVQAGARSVSPGIRVSVRFTGNQNDPIAGAQAAQDLITGGADVLVIALNNGLSGAVDAVLAAEHPVYFTSLHTDKHQIAPQNFLASMEFDYAGAYEQAVVTLLDPGNGERYRLMDPANGGVTFSETYNVDPATLAAFDRDVADLASGALAVPVPEPTGA